MSIQRSHGQKRIRHQIFERRFFYFQIPLSNLQKSVKFDSFFFKLLKLAEELTELKKCKRVSALLKSFKNGPYPFLTDNPSFDVIEISYRNLPFSFQKPLMGKQQLLLIYISEWNFASSIYLFILISVN